MAGVRFTVDSNEVAVGAAATKTILQIAAPANQRVLIDEISIMGKGTSATDTPIKVELRRQSDAGTGGNALTATKNDSSDSETLQAVCLGGLWATTEPTNLAGNPLRTWEFHPQQGLYILFPAGQEIRVPGGGRLALIVTTGQAETVAAVMGGQE